MGQSFHRATKRLVDLTPTDIDALRALIECEVQAEKRRDLVIDGYQCSKLSFVKEGVAARYKVLRNGKRQVVHVLLPGDIVGLPGSFLDRATMSVIALTDMKLEVCSLDAFVAACYRRPKFALALGGSRCRRRQLRRARVDVGRRTPVERVRISCWRCHARLLLVGRATESGFELPVSQEVMGDALGLACRTSIARWRGCARRADRRASNVTSNSPMCGASASRALPAGPAVAHPLPAGRERRADRPRGGRLRCLEATRARV